MSQSILAIYADFNTSHVSINRNSKPIESVSGSNFNTSPVSIKTDIAPVKQVFSSISIHLMFLLIISGMAGSNSKLYNFNTSHVSINRNINEARALISQHFNTSHVSINPFKTSSKGLSIIISIHLMFLLIQQGTT